MTRHDMLSPRGVRFRDGFGLVTIEETAARYGTDRARIADAAHVGEARQCDVPVRRRRSRARGHENRHGGGMAGRTAVAPTPANALRFRWRRAFFWRLTEAIPQPPLVRLQMTGNHGEDGHVPLWG